MAQNNEQLKQSEKEFNDLISTLNIETNQDLRNQLAEDASIAYAKYRALMQEAIAKSGNL